jgi:cytochrome c-type biogenesis protein CcmE
MTRKKRRGVLIAAALGVLGLAAALVLIAMEESIVFFQSPSDVASKTLEPGKRFRLGGLVAEGSLKRGKGTTIRFDITDNAKSVAVSYTGILPDLFREGQGVVSEGALDGSGVFIADTVLAKHDETYMPPEVAASLKKQGVWRGPAGTAAQKAP